LTQEEADGTQARRTGEVSKDEKVEDAVDYSDEEELADDDSASVPESSQIALPVNGCDKAGSS
jgi:hypothetical protein